MFTNGDTKTRKHYEEINHAGMTRQTISLIFTILLCEVSCGYRILYSSSSGLFTESDDVEGFKNGDNSTAKFPPTRQVKPKPTQRTRWSDNQRRPKRGTVLQLMSEERKKAECYKRIYAAQGYSGLPINLAVYVEVGESVSFTCHYCYDGWSQYASMIWKRIMRKQVDGYVEVKEVEVDMNDDESLNRITVGKDHKLYIKDVRREDEGVYFCQNFITKDKLIKERMDASMLDAVRKSETYRIHYNFDVILPSDMKPREVSRSPDKKSMAPLAPEVDEKANLLLLTVWQSWGQCSTCGQPGLRKRLGTCIIKHNELRLRLKNFFMETLLRVYKAGLPCRLTLFTYLENKVTRPDELEEEACNITCPLGASLFKSSSMSADGIKTSIAFDKEQKKQVAVHRELTVPAGETVNMTCPGPPVAWTVVWTNDSRIVDVSVTGSESRVMLHADNVLEINSVAVWDSATYRCVSRDQVKARVILTVTPRAVPDTAPWLFAYFTSLTYPADFLLFLLLMLVKHRHRRAGRRLTNAQLRDMESFSSLGSRWQSRRYLSSQTDASRRYLSSQTDASRRYLSSQTYASRGYLSSQTDASRGYLSSQTDASRGYLSSQTDASRGYLPSQLDEASKLYLSSNSDASRRYFSDETDESRSYFPDESRLYISSQTEVSEGSPNDTDKSRPNSNETDGDDLERDSLLSYDGETLSNKSERILDNDIFTAANEDSDIEAVSATQAQWGVSRRQNHNVNRPTDSNTSLETDANVGNQDELIF